MCVYVSAFVCVSEIKVCVCVRVCVCTQEIDLCVCVHIGNIMYFLFMAVGEKVYPLSLWASLA